jgi:hypothetical protein
MNEEHTSSVYISFSSQPPLHDWYDMTFYEIWYINKYNDIDIEDYHWQR